MSSALPAQPYPTTTIRVQQQELAHAIDNKMWLVAMLEDTRAELARMHQVVADLRALVPEGRSTEADEAIASPLRPVR